MVPRDSSATKQGKKGEEQIDMYGELREEAGMKPYYHGPMDRAKTSESATSCKRAKMVVTKGESRKDMRYVRKTFLWKIYGNHILSAHTLEVSLLAIGTALHLERDA